MLRYYQQDAVNAAYRYFSENSERNPCVVLPTGAGKTHVIAQVCRDVLRWGGRVLVLAHVKELLDQAAQKLSDLKPGVYSASLKKRQHDKDVVVAGIQSVYKRGFELCGSQPFNMVIIDEAHRIPVEGNGMYVQLLDDLKTANPKMRILGLTATPYRTGEGYVCSDEHFLNDICYEADIRELIAGGFLCRLSSRRSRSEVDMSGVSVRKGDFVSGEMESRFNDADKVSQAVNEMVSLTADRKKCLIFTCGIEHASNVAYMLESVGESVRLVTSQHGERDQAIEAFKAGRCKFLVNVNILTEGFDETAIDSVVLLRATVSPGLYYQMVGRGLRIDPSKEDCLVLDYGGNIQRHGTIDNLQIKGRGGNREGDAPVKACPQCQAMIHAGLLVCSECGHEFEQSEPNHEESASQQEAIGTPYVDTEYEVGSVRYSFHVKRSDPNATPSMRVTYYEGEDIGPIADEWICIQHEGFAYKKALDWWSRRTTHPMPDSIEKAISFADRGGLAEPSKITVRKKAGVRWLEIIDWYLDKKIDPSDVASEEELNGVFEEEEIPW